MTRVKLFALLPSTNPLKSEKDKQSSPCLHDIYKLIFIFFPINLSCIMNDLLQHYFRAFGKILLIIFQKNNVFFPPPVWVPKPCDDLHVCIDNLIWEQIIYLCLQSKCTPCIGLEELCH